VFTEGEHTVTEGTYWAYGSATVRAQGLATVHAYGSATVIAYGSATVRAYNSVTVKECTDYAIVRHWADTEPCVPTGPNALVVDYRNGTMRVISNAQ
jgi:hypothetical protein